jgi:hypothetical protein
MADTHPNFGSTDQVLMLLVISSANLIDKAWPPEKQAEVVAQHLAVFMRMRYVHDTAHVAKPWVLCPFCAGVALSISTNSEAVKTEWEK